MKNVLFGIIAFAAFAFNGIAQEKKDINQKADFKSASLITTYDNQVTEYKFLSLVELNDEIEQIIQELDFDNAQGKKHNTCKIIIEIKVEITIGTTIGIMAGLINTSCNDAANETKRLKAMLLAAAMVN